MYKHTLEALSSTRRRKMGRVHRRVCKIDNTHVEEREIEKLPSGETGGQTGGETGGNEGSGSGNGEASNPGIPGNTGPSEPEVQVKKPEPKYNGERYRVLDTSVKGPRPSAKLLGTKTLAKAVRKLKVHARIKPGRAIRPVQPKPTPVER